MLRLINRVLDRTMGRKIVIFRTKPVAKVAHNNLQVV